MANEKEETVFPLDEQTKPTAEKLRKLLEVYLNSGIEPDPSIALEDLIDWLSTDGLDELNKIED